MSPGRLTGRTRKARSRNVSSIRTEPGKFEDYLAWLAGPYKQLMEAQKAAGLIVDYAVYATTPRSPNDPDLYLVTVYKNMAALDDFARQERPDRGEAAGQHGRAEQGVCRARQDAHGARL